MFAKEALEEIERWRRQATASQHQLDWRWVERYRELASYDSYWWLTWAGPFTEEEQQHWKHLFTPPLNESTKYQLGTLMGQSRERELAAAIAEQREPRLSYPAIEIDEVRRRITALVQLDAEIGQHEPNAIVRRLYHGTISEEIDYLSLIEATYESNTERFWECNLRLFPVPTDQDMKYVLSRVRSTLRQGLTRSETAEVSQRLQEFLDTYLFPSFNLTLGEETLQEEQQKALHFCSQEQRKVSVQTARRFFETTLHECGYEGWRVEIDPNASSARIEQGLRRLFLPEKQFSLEEVRHLFSHELAGHVARSIAGERSLLGLLGIHSKNSLSAEEGLALYYERQIARLHEQAFDDAGIRMSTLAIGLASGVVMPPQTFFSLFTFLESFSLLRRLLKYSELDAQKAQKQARTYALSICLRTYRGVPDLGHAGMCYLQDGVYLRGLRMIEQAVAQDESVLDRLAVGVCALEDLPDLEELGIVSTPQALRKLAYAPDLDTYILSFEEAEETAEKET